MSRSYLSRETSFGVNGVYCLVAFAAGVKLREEGGKARIDGGVLRVSPAPYLYNLSVYAYNFWGFFCFFFVLL